MLIKFKGANGTDHSFEFNPALVEQVYVLNGRNWNEQTKQGEFTETFTPSVLERFNAWRRGEPPPQPFERKRLPREDGPWPELMLVQRPRVVVRYASGENDTVAFNTVAEALAWRAELVKYVNEQGGSVP